MKSIYVVLFVALLSLNAIAQSVNDYKYVIVPDRFSWTNVADEYQVNSLTTFLFKKYGFDAYQLGSILPPDMNAGGCNALTADVEDIGSFVKTRLKVIVKDCKGEIVFISEEGSSKNKDYKQAYHEALRNAFLSVKELQYSYSNKEMPTPESNQVITPPVSPSKTKPNQAAVKEEVKEVALEESIKEVVVQKPLVQKYVGLDGAYSMTLREGVVTFYEGDKKIGTAHKKAVDFYQVEATEFEGKGYFLNNKFIIERQIKGIQGLVKMIFEKE